MPIEKIELLILTTLALEPLHGFGIGQRIEQMSGGEFRITLGTLYPALQRLERAGHVTSEWTTSDNNRRARYYRITPQGRSKATESRETFTRTVHAMMRVLDGVSK